MTYKEIAEKLNISPSTVSMVINNRPGVNEETRARVLSALAEEGLSTERGTKKKNRHAIRFIKYKKYGKVIDEHGFISTVTEGVDSGANELGYEVLSSTMDATSCDAVMQAVYKDPHDGLILLGTELDASDLAILDGIAVPVVILDSCFDVSPYDSVTMNNVGIAYAAVEHLRNKGYEQIGHLKSSLKIANFIGRRQGYLGALKEMELEFNPKWTFRLDPTVNGAYADMKRSLEQNGPLPNAFFADNDTIAVGACKAFKEHGLQIPHDIAVIGVDNIPYGMMIEPPLSTMAIFNLRMGAIAAKRLIEKIETQDQCVIKQKVSAVLVERGTV